MQGGETRFAEGEIVAAARSSKRRWLPWIVAVRAWAVPVYASIGYAMAAFFAESNPASLGHWQRTAMAVLITLGIAAVALVCGNRSGWARAAVVL